MKKIKKKKILIIFFLIIIIFFAIILIKNKKIKKEKNEIIIQEEISEEEFRKTAIKLYFINNISGEIESEIRWIDVKELIKNPYEIIINMLINGGKRDYLMSYIPKNTKINKIELKSNLLIINFSNEFNLINNLNNKNKIINIIEKSLAELLEINRVEIIVDE